ncbi:hypothetical protein E3Q23_03488 [Wallemia mellicola]|uniref:Ribosomal protein 60S n=3 Tax=Wallemia mellicola TaxID=1708541 RepID=A0A4T0SIH5_9BASI|nr:hypothetical protein E3Q23_03488 [Wallemia mellicola]TIC50808.1 hypothetical protein E3Q05_03322 [Wallemia mellicola]TIC63278.1 hypothetical protein E3Q01_03450 [Wallemia mellicola]
MALYNISSLLQLERLSRKLVEKLSLGYFTDNTQMKLVAAYLLLTVGGNTSPSAEDVKKLLSTVGVEADESRLTKLIEELNGKNLEELIAQGTEKLASVPSASAAAAPAAGAAPAAAAEEAPKKEEAKEESDDDMGLGLFD